MIFSMEMSKNEIIDIFWKDLDNWFIWIYFYKFVFKMKTFSYSTFF